MSTEKEKEQDILNALLNGLSIEEQPVTRPGKEMRKIKERGAPFFTRCNMCGFTTQTDVRNRCHYCLQVKRVTKSPNY